MEVEKNIDYYRFKCTHFGFARPKPKNIRRYHFVDDMVCFVGIGHEDPAFVSDSYTVHGRDHRLPPTSPCLPRQRRRPQQWYNHIPPQGTYIAIYHLRVHA